MRVAPGEQSGFRHMYTNTPIALKPLIVWRDLETIVSFLALLWMVQKDKKMGFNPDSNRGPLAIVPQGRP